MAAKAARIATEQRNRIDLAVAERHSVIALGFNPMNRHRKQRVAERLCEDIRLDSMFELSLMRHITVDDD